MLDPRHNPLVAQYIAQYDEMCVQDLESSNNTILATVITSARQDGHTGDEFGDIILALVQHIEELESAIRHEI